MPEICECCGKEHMTQEELEAGNIDISEVNHSTLKEPESDIAKPWGEGGILEEPDPNNIDVSKVEDESAETEICEKKSVVWESYRDPE